MRVSLKEYCLRFGREELLEQWHPHRNLPLTPESVSHGSHAPVWWRCDRDHSWQSPPYARTGKGSGCPYCAGRRVSPEQSLQARYPLLAAQWHPDKNGSRSPADFLPGSHEPVWWRCDRGHEWRAGIKSRVEGCGCPVCAGRTVLAGENDLAAQAPLLALQWHPEKNGTLLPRQVSPGSARRVWWRCDRGHEWQAEIASRVRGAGCPVCAGKVVVPGENDLKSRAPELALQWHPEKNGGLGPDAVSAFSNRRVWWRCHRGHEWRSAVSDRVTGRTGCPFCAGKRVLPGFNDLKTLQPLVAAQWHPTRNGTLEPTMVTPGCSKKVWWRCTDGHEWKAVVYSRAGAQRCGCPVCAGRPGRHNGG